MSCGACIDILVTDDVWPDCFEGQCIIPEPDGAGYRAIDIRNKLVILGGLIGPESVLRMNNATDEDLDMICFIEETLRSLKERDSERG